LTLFYFVLTASIKNTLITGKGLAIGGGKYILKQMNYRCGILDFKLIKNVTSISLDF
jgi:hypothetical protein